MKIAIEPIGSVAGYESFASSIPEAMVTFSPSWLGLIQSTAGGEGFMLTARQEGDLKAALPFFISPDRGHGTVLNSLPFFGSSSGVLIDTELEQTDLIGKMLEQLVEEAQRRNCRSLVLISSLLDSEHKNGLYRSVIMPDHEDYRIGQATILDCGKEELIDRFAPCKRNNVRNAIRQGVTLRESCDAEDWDWVIQMHEVRMEAMGGTAKPKSFKTWGLDAIKNNPACRLTIAEIDGKRCAGLLTIQHGRFTEYAFPVSDWDLRASKGMFLLIHESMQYSIDTGKDIYNFGGTWKTQTSLYEFKNRFAASDYNYYYYIKILDKTVYDCTPEQLIDAFPMYYVIPFDALNTGE